MGVDTLTMLCWFTSRKKAWVGFSCKRRLEGQGQDDLGQLTVRASSANPHDTVHIGLGQHNQDLLPYAQDMLLVSHAELLGALSPQELGLCKAPLPKHCCLGQSRGDSSI